MKRVVSRPAIRVRQPRDTDRRRTHVPVGDDVEQSEVAQQRAV
jgi:hypothetical protein